jgi:hypothetical protein
MKQGQNIFFLLFFFITTVYPGKYITAQHNLRSLSTEVLVIGGGTGGTAAGIQCARMGVKTMIVEPTHMLGGMLTAAGVSCTDGNNSLPSGIWEEFRQALYKHYGTNQLNTGWVSNTCFEPHVADSIFKDWARKETSLTMEYGYYFDHVIKSGDKVTGAVFINDKNNGRLEVNAKLIIDATELGDVFANAGAAYDLGMDDPKESGEAKAGTRNNIIQDITWVAVLKDYGKGEDKTIPKPPEYDEKKYYCCNNDAPCKGKSWDGEKIKMLNYGKLPNNKYMLNWPFYGNDFYLNVVEENNETRAKKYESAKQQTLGFVYFLQTKLKMKHIGLADDELDYGLAYIPYNREGRRIKGETRLSIEQIKNPYQYTLYRTGISVGDYPVDHHHAQYAGKIPDIRFPLIPSYNIPLGTLILARIDGLIVCEKGISVSNIVNGTTRLQPVVMLTGQAAGVLAALSIKGEEEPRNVPVRFLQQELLDDSCYLMPFVDVGRNDKSWKAIQRAGLTGILHGAGKPEGWENKTFFYPDSIVSVKDFSKNLLEYDSSLMVKDTIDSQWVNWRYLSQVIREINNKENTFEGLTKQATIFFKQMRFEVFDPKRNLTRKEIAALLDRFCLEWLMRDVDINGNVVDLGGGIF